MAIPEEALIVEDLGRNGFKAIQIKDGFKFGTDSVLLAWFASSFIRNTSREVKVLELGSNTGVVSLLVAARKENTLIDSVELMENEAIVLNRNITLNNLQSRMRGFNADIKDLPQEVKNRQYDVVFFNPPYFNNSFGSRASSIEGETGSRADGRFENNGDLIDFVKCAASRVVPTSGHICMVMHGNRLSDAIMAFNSCGIKPTRLMTVHSFANRDASVFLIAGKKGSKGTDLKILPPLIINVKDDKTGAIMSTEKIIEIYNKEHSDCFI